MKKLLLFAVFTAFSIQLSAQGYTVEAIGYNPPHSYVNIPTTLMIDDFYSEVIPLDFDFEFYGQTYNELVIGTNGVISFDTSLASGYCPWNFEEDVPDINFPIKNAILAPYQDYNPGISGELNYATYGTAPNRRFVLNLYQLPLFACNDLFNTIQVVLYETTNTIDFYLEEKTACITWNDANAVLGIINEDGTLGLTAPDRNTSNSPWEVELEAWRISFYQGDLEAFDAFFGLCDMGNGGFEEFDLNLIVPDVIGNQTGVTVSFHESFLDANNNVNQLANPYTNTSNPQTIYARVEDSMGLYETSEVTLEVLACVDEDNDGVETAAEDLNGDGFPGNDDTDNDGIPNYLDPDDDNDLVLTADEITGIGAGVIGGGYEFIDTDLDGIENYLDNDDDGDGLTTNDEDYNQNGDPIDDDLDNDGIPDFLDDFFDLGTNDELLENMALIPNPAHTKVAISGVSNLSNLQVEVLSLNGQRLLISTDSSIDLAALPKGMYLIIIKSEEIYGVRKLVKK